VEKKEKEMKTIKIIALITALFLAGCSDDDDNNPGTPNGNVLTLNLTGLENLGANYQYEGWIMVDGSPKTTGVFDVDDNGNLGKKQFTINADDLSKATAFILTIEPKPDNDPMPSDVHLVAGDFSGATASLNAGHMAALGNNFMNSSGKYILATPTDGMNTNEKSGIWFLDNSSGSPAAGLNLPQLPNGWVYEGWAVINGNPVTTGKFTSVSAADQDAPFSGSMPGPPFPGEDFLMNAPAGLTFPTDLAGGMGVISIEPVPDNDPKPFLLKPLAGQIPADAMDHTVYNLNQNLSSFPTGSAVR
jgi:hypothetical protein